MFFLSVWGGHTNSPTQVTGPTVWVIDLSFYSLTMGCIGPRPKLCRILEKQRNVFDHHSLHRNTQPAPSNPATGDRYLNYFRKIMCEPTTINNNKAKKCPGVTNYRLNHR